MTMRIVLFGLTLTVLPVAVAAAAPASKPVKDRYTSCLALSDSNPLAALGEANGWSRSGGGVAADHCAALALVSLKRYGEAAAKLDAIARAPGVPNIAMRAEIFDQAGNAWMLDGNARNADASFSSALALGRPDPDLYADLARAKAMQKDWRSAEADLNAALALMPERPDLLVLRASALHAMGRKAQARADIAHVLSAHPGYADALIERGVMKSDEGDFAGARADWQEVASGAPQSLAGQEARKRIADLDAAIAAAAKSRPAPAKK